MKVEEQNVATFNVGRKETAVAQIQASAKAFEILSSGLYSDAEFAIVREIAANAWDSHKAAGKADVPFRIQIPTALDPRFCIRDFGTSMSHQFMMTRVNTYFDSTKNDNNDEIGGFGLGIKSVFSYTTSFMIACFQDGQRRVYVYQIGEKGLPEISLMAESVTDEPDGVEVSIPVKEADYNKFMAAVKKTFAFYTTKPEVIGMDLNIPEFQKVVDGTGWFVCATNDTFTREVYVEMGGIAYPVESNIHDLYFYGKAQSLFLQAKIGQIDITPNREQVKLTDKTKKFVEEAIKVVKDEIHDVVQQKVDASNFANYWEMVEFINKLGSDMINKLGYEKSKITFRGKTFDDDVFTVRKLAIPQWIDPMDETQGKTTPVITDDMVPHANRFTTWELTRGGGRIKKDDHSYRGDSSARFDRFQKPNKIVVMEDKMAIHVGRWMRSQPYPAIRNINVVYVDFGKAVEVVAKIKEVLQGYEDVINAADLTYEKDTSIGGRVERKYYIYHSAAYEAVVRSEVDLNVLPDTVYYLPTDGRQQGALFSKGQVNYKNEMTFISTAHSWLGINKIYYLTEGMISKIEKHCPDVELKRVDNALTALLEDKVREAGLNYFDRDLDAIKAPFAREAGGWRVDQAIEFWSKRWGLTDFADAKKTLKSHQPDKNLEKMCYLVSGKTISDLFVQYGISVQTVTCPHLDSMLVKMPYVFAMVNSYSHDAILKHIEDTMGWTVVDSTPSGEEDDYD